MFDICIIGGGASAMAAAITAAKEAPHLRICILEKKEVLGKKILATGNGKCNMTNARCAGARQTLEFFDAIGVVTRQDNAGRIYPYSEQAKEVVYGLRRQIGVHGINVQTDCEVTQVEGRGHTFEIFHKRGKVEAKKTLIAAGGKAGPQYGTTGDGYKFARSLGHTVTRVAPILTAFEGKEDFRKLKGIRAKGGVTLWKNGVKIAQEIGEIQFTEDGLSGISIFNLSRFVKIKRFEDGFGEYAVSVDFTPDMSQHQVENFLESRRNIDGLIAEDFLLSVLARPLALNLLTSGGIPLTTLAESISEEKLQSLAALLKCWRIQLSGVKGWKAAQCTSGGVPLEELDMDTMESRLVKDLYFAGEIINFDGPCGGFNLQNAWETGIKAGKAMSNV